MTQYTFTIPAKEESKFRQIMDRLDPDEYNIIKEIHAVDTNDLKSCDRQTIMTMDPEAALTFRLGTSNVKIRRDRTEEELAEEKRINDQHTIKITVKVDGLNDRAPDNS